MYLKCSILNVFGILVISKKIFAQESKYYTKSETDKTLVGFLCTWEEGWCNGWYNRDQSNDKYFAEDMVRVEISKESAGLIISAMVLIVRLTGFLRINVIYLP